jgi:hypothetical protein
VHADRAVTHKRYASNVMIGPPAQRATDEFTADLMIDDRCELLADHLTGQHIPAVTLMEAARQMWTAVTECFYRDGPHETHFVVGALSGQFRHFVFPFAATLCYQLLGHEVTAVGQLFRCRIGVEQNGRRAADIASSYRVIPAEVGEKHEARAARQVLAGEIGRLTPLQPVTPQWTLHPDGSAGSSSTAR